MLHSISKPLLTAMASVSTIAAVTLTAGLVSLEVKAEPKLVAAVQSESTSVPAKADRLAVTAKGSACSSLGWPHYEQRCQFDMRRSGERTQIRIIALR